MNHTFTIHRLLPTPRDTLKFTVLLFLVFMLLACGSNRERANAVAASSLTTHAHATTGELSKPVLANMPGPAAVRCSAEQATLAYVLLTLTNQARATAQRCGSKKFPSVAPLTLHPVLSVTAKAHSDDMASADFFSHKGSDGLQVWDRALARGYQYRTIAENIAAGHESAAEVHAGWLNSPTHCENLMNPDVTHFGAACTASENAELRRYWGTVFARPRNETLPL